MSGCSVGIVVQARMGSTRLPGKVLKHVGKWVLLEHIARRCELLRTPAKLVFATSMKQSDDAVVAWCASRNFAYFRGSEDNVLERYTLCAREYEFTHIVRLTGDNPFPDMEELDKLLALHLREQAEFSYSFPALPIGVGAEIFAIQALETCLANAHMPHHFEHADEYILDNIANFNTRALPPVPEKYRPDIRLTIDTEEDYERCVAIVARSGEMVSTVEAIAACAWI